MIFLDKLAVLHASALAVAPAGAEAHAAEDVPMFGFAWPKFLAQILIFYVVYLVLKKKAFAPIVAMLEARRQRIVEAEAMRERVTKELERAGQAKKDIIAQAGADAARLLAEAREGATAVAEKKRQEASLEASQIIAKAHEAAALDRDRVMTELRSEFGRLVADTASRVTGKVLNDDDKTRLNEEAVTSLKN